MSEQGPSDAELEALLGAMFGDDSPPSQLSEFALAAFDFPRLDQELADLVYDSTAEPATSGVRSAGGAQIHLSFTQGDLSLDAEWDPTEPISISGQFEASAPRTLTMHQVDGTRHVPLNELGEFELRELSRGPIRFTGESSSGQLETDWFNL